MGVVLAPFVSVLGEGEEKEKEEEGGVPCVCDNSFGLLGGSLFWELVSQR